MPRDGPAAKRLRASRDTARVKPRKAAGFRPNGVSHRATGGCSSPGIAGHRASRAAGWCSPSALPVAAARAPCRHIATTLLRVAVRSAAVRQDPLRRSAGSHGPVTPAPRLPFVGKAARVAPARAPLTSPPLSPRGNFQDTPRSHWSGGYAGLFSSSDKPKAINTWKISPRSNTRCGLTRRVHASTHVAQEKYHAGDHRRDGSGYAFRLRDRFHPIGSGEHHRHYQAEKPKPLDRGSQNLGGQAVRDGHMGRLTCLCTSRPAAARGRRHPPRVRASRRTCCGRLRPAPREPSGRGFPPCPN
jgi:hypothetical protein